MTKLAPLQELLTNDLRVFRGPFLKEIEEVSGVSSHDKGKSGEGFQYRVPSLESFETWLITGIVGGRRPSTYSDSPRLWNPYFGEIDRNGVFFSFDLPGDVDFSFFLKTLLDIPGFLELTITDPYKHRALEVLKGLKRPFSLSPQAEHTGTVNHIILDKGRNHLTGLNTDGLGMMRAIKSIVELSGRRVLLIGAGGSAASIGYEAVRAGSDLDILNRTPARAEDLIKRLIPFKHPGQTLDWGGFERLPGRLPRTDILINTVAEGCPLGIDDMKLLRGHAMVAETKYGGKSELREPAMKADLAYLDGQAMLFGQFVEAADSLFPLLGVSERRHNRAVRSIKELLQRA